MHGTHGRSPEGKRRCVYTLPPTRTVREWRRSRGQLTEISDPGTHPMRAQELAQSRRAPERALTPLPKTNMFGSVGGFSSLLGWLRAAHLSTDMRPKRPVSDLHPIALGRHFRTWGSANLTALGF